MGTRILFGLCVLSVGAATGVGLARWIDPADRNAGAPVRVVPPARLASLQGSFVATAEAATKSVVHITTLMRPISPFDEQPTQSVGSGVIVSAEGHILTNHHVVRGARKLQVLFPEGRRFPAEVIGVDAESDLALLRIRPLEEVPLTPIRFGDSDQARVGEWVLAIGSPFGYNNTVTSGILSAKHRRPGLDLTYQDFLQTDAAINPGNSGGALVNLSGELIGINTAIASNTRSSDGVGFAIPSNLARWVYERLAREGRVRRGYLGVKTYDINEDLLQILYRDSEDVRTLEDILEDLRIEKASGALVLEDPGPTTPAGRAGLKKGDVLVDLNGRKIRNQTDLFLEVAKVTPGEEVVLRYLRNGQPRTATTEAAERPER